MLKLTIYCVWRQPFVIYGTYLPIIELLPCTCFCTICPYFCTFYIGISIKNENVGSSVEKKTIWRLSNSLIYMTAFLCLLMIYLLWNGVLIIQVPRVSNYVESTYSFQQNSTNQWAWLSAIIFELHIMNCIKNKMKYIVDDPAPFWIWYNIDKNGNSNM